MNITVFYDAYLKFKSFDLWKVQATVLQSMMKLYATYINGGRVH